MIISVKGKSEIMKSMDEDSESNKMSYECRGRD